MYASRTPMGLALARPTCTPAEPHGDGYSQANLYINKNPMELANMYTSRTPWSWL